MYTTRKEGRYEKKNNIIVKYIDKRAGIKWV